MKISVDGKELFTLSDIQKKVIQNDVASDRFEEDMKRRLKWVLLDEKYHRCMSRLRREWEPKLKARGVSMLPAQDDAFAALVFSQADYKSKSQRDNS